MCYEMAQRAEWMFQLDCSVVSFPLSGVVGCHTDWIKVRHMNKIEFWLKKKAKLWSSRCYTMSNKVDVRVVCV